MLHWCIGSSIPWSLCDRLATSFLILLPVICHIYLKGKAVGGIFLGHVVCLGLLILCYCSRSLHLSGFCLWIPLVTTWYCCVLHSLRTTSHPSLAEDLLLDLHPMHLFSGITVPFYCRIPCLHAWLCSWPYCTGFGLFCSIFYSHFGVTSFLIVHITLQLMAGISPGSSLSLKRIEILFLYRGSISVSACSFFGSDCTVSPPQR